VGCWTAQLVIFECGWCGPPTTDRKILFMNREEAMQIYKDRSEKFKNTQVLQWKMNVSIWTLLALAIFYKHTLSLDLYFQIVIGIILTTIHFWYCFKVQKSLQSDKSKKNEIIEKLNKLDGDVKLAQENEMKIWDWISWIIIQVAITATLALIFILSSSLNHSNCN